MTDIPPAYNSTAVELKDRVVCVRGFGHRSMGDGYLFQPVSTDEMPLVFDQARRSGRQICLRGAGRSYGDASVGSECLIVEFSRMNRILSWEPDTGLLDCEAGVTIEDIWRHVIGDGYWLPVVSGTMFPQIGGALAMNIHGKNNYAVGTLGEHVVELRVITPDGVSHVLTQNDRLFFDFISSAGLLGVIVGCKIALKKVDCGDLKVYANAPGNWMEQIKTFEQFEPEADYMVSWIDCFAKGKHSGRGQFHAAWYEKTSGSGESLLHSHQDLPEKLFAVLPKSLMWRFLKPLNNNFGMRLLNSAKFASARLIGNGKIHRNSLVGFSFLLDYVPDWKNAYLPGGFIQYQSFVPKENALEVFRRQVEIQHQSKITSFLGVMKRHRPDRFLFSHAVDGFSLALDFKVTDQNWSQLQSMCHKMNDVVLGAGGKFYFAKDSTLRASDVQGWLGSNLTRFSELKAQFDPENLLTSDLARRVSIVGGAVK